MGISPNMLTLLGLAGNVIALLFFIKAAPSSICIPELRFGTEAIDFGALTLAGVFILIGGLFDILDGRVARITGNTSDAGALFDSVIDRYAEMLMLGGILFLAFSVCDFKLGAGAFAALCGSVMVSYTRARIEGLHGESPGGLFQRPERIVLISVAVILSGIAGKGDWFSQHSYWYLDTILCIAIWLVALGSIATAFYRFVGGYRSLKNRDTQ